MKIHGFNKTTLLDYPGHIAATIFLGGCNFRCPFCHNASLVLSPEMQPTISDEEVFNTLIKRQGILEGVCITGGEPTLYFDLIDFIKRIKDLGYLVKLDTNGYNPEHLQNLIKLGLIDYVAMDIKNSKEKYSLSTGILNFDTSKITESINLLLSSGIDYEFRTTVVKEHHTMDDFKSIGLWIKGAKAYYLQAFRDSKDTLTTGLSSYSKSELENFKEAVHPYIKTIGIRGID
jgi:pyruvate formate lyase activating enzyme